MDDEVPIDAPPEPPPEYVNLIDPKLKARALKRLQGIVRGNGIKIDDVKLETCEATVLPFGARTFVKMAPRYGVRIEPGQNRKAELAVTQEAFQQSLASSVLMARTDPVKRQSIVDFLFIRPDKGFGMKDQKVKFHKLERDLVTHEGCITCSKLGKTQCQKCTGRGMIACNLCQSRKQITCPQCRGSGKTPGGRDHSCVRCRGDGRIQCTQCNGQGQMKCPSCAASGTLKCQKCAGTGWLSHLAHVEMEAQLHFDFEREVLPVEVVRMIDAFGSRLVEKGDVEVILRPTPATVPEIQATNEPDDTIFIDYEAKVPFGPIHFRLKDRVIPATLFGYHGKLIEAPSFLDDITRKGQQILAEAAAGTGDVAEKIRRAAKYRLLSDVITQAAGKARQKQAMDILTNRYPTGIDADKILSLFIHADQALKAITRKPRLYGLLGGLTLFAALGGAYFFMGRTFLGVQGIPSAGLLAIDIILLFAGLLFGAAGSHIASVIALEKALKGLTSTDMSTGLKPKLGNILWGALAGSAIIWAVLLGGVMVAYPEIAPSWVTTLINL